MENTQLKELYLKATNQTGSSFSQKRKEARLYLYGAAFFLPISVYSWIVTLTVGGDGGWVTIVAAFLAFISSGVVLVCLICLAFVLAELSWADKPSQFTGEDPAVLKTILDYLGDKVLRPKDEFVTAVQEDLKKLKGELAFYKKDQHTLRDLAIEEADTHLNLINVEALQRSQAILENLRALRATLLSQKRRAEQMVRPIKADIARFEQHLTRLTRDQKQIETRNMVIAIANKIPAYENFLLNLEKECEQVEMDLRLLSSEAIALGAARAEVRMDSSLSEEELQLGS